MRAQPSLAANRPLSANRRSTLDEDIDAIDEFDRLRSYAEQLRQTGFEELSKVTTEPPKNRDENWLLEKDKADLIRPALVYLVATRDFARDNPKHDKFRELAMNDLPNAASMQEFVIEQTLAKSKPALFPIFQAARVLQAMLVTPQNIFSRQSMLAYYTVVRELATVADNKGFGSARATKGGIVSAFMTGECARGVSAMADVLHNTAKVVQDALDFFQAWADVASLARTFKANDCLQRWMQMDITRIGIGHYTFLMNVGRRSAVSLSHDDFADLLDRNKTYEDQDEAVEAFFKLFCDRFDEAAKNAAKQIKDARAMIEANFLKEAKEDDSGDPLLKGRRQLAHDVAFRAVDFAEKLADQAGLAGSVLRSYLASGSYAKTKVPKKITDFIKGLYNRSAEVRRLLSSTSMYLESVLDREIERASIGLVNAAELACAAASYSQLEKPEMDRRLERATEILCQEIALNGIFTNPSSLDSDNRGYRAMVLGSEVLRAFAQLLEKVHLDIDPETVSRMLSYFDGKAVAGSAGTTIGWSSDEPRHPRMALKWTSALAILALDQITRTLDAIINRRVFRHFAHRSAKSMAGKLALEALFYPDYGLAGTASLGKDGPEGPIAYVLEGMRAHVVGVAKPPGQADVHHSLLLFGPPGTGKTQLAESLATSSGADYVEITPSDFLVEGEALIERRARNVFRCLSLLTRTVILFDEFDPMIRSRKLASQTEGGLDFYAFITPGMLPKLKLLNEQAKKRKVAFCLITNRVGTLDEAAIRSGRFDCKIGIYPPDLLSRAGRLAFTVNKLRRSEKSSTPLEATHRERMWKVIVDTAGGGMTFLGRPGNYTAVKSLADAKKGSFLGFIFDKEIDAKFARGRKDAEEEESNIGRNVVEEQASYRKREIRQWGWISDQDKSTDELWDELHKALTTPRS